MRRAWRSRRKCMCRLLFATEFSARLRLAAVRSLRARRRLACWSPCNRSSHGPRSVLDRCARPSKANPRSWPRMVIHAAMRRERVTQDAIDAALRNEGFDYFVAVRCVVLRGGVIGAERRSSSGRGSCIGASGQAMSGAPVTDVVLLEAGIPGRTGLDQEVCEPLRFQPSSQSDRSRGSRTMC